MRSLYQADDTLQKRKKKMIQPNTSSARIMENNIATPVKARVKPQVFG
jgi:hypothetical protein